MDKRIIWIWTGLLSLCLLLSQTATDAVADFSPPVQGQMQLTGTFGELRGNHFHAGLDIRGHIGRPVYAIADGFVSRVVTEIAGYGQALYLDHPSGHTSVYAHLDRFVEDISVYVKREQYNAESFELDIEPEPTRFPVRKGDLIGYIGKRGYAFGPHLHFEIRDAETQDPLNPMAFGISVSDNRRPFVNEVRVYDLDERGNVRAAKSYSTRHRGQGRYVSVPDTIWVNGPSAGLALKAYDQQDNLNNWNGIYRIEMRQQDSLLYQVAFNRYAFADTRYLNAHLDYAEQENNSWFHRSFRLPGNKLDVYEPPGASGRIHLQPGQARQLDFLVTDFAGNAAEVRLVVKRRQSGIPVYSDEYTYRIPFDEASLIDNGSIRAHFPEDCFYEDLFLDYELVNEQSAGLYSPVHRLGRADIPVHQYFDLQLRPNAIPDELRDKVFIAYCEDGQHPVTYGGEWTKNGQLRAPVRTLGNFCIMLDDEPPVVEAERFAEDMRGWAEFSFVITDNIRAVGKAHDLRYRAEVDGQWILMEYDYKSDRLFHQFDNIILPGRHQLVLRVWDDRGNETMVERDFIK